MSGISKRVDAKIANRAVRGDFSECGAAPITSKPSASREASSTPRSVAATARLVLFNYFAPIRLSRRRIGWLAADGITPSSIAADLKLYLGTMVVKRLKFA